MNELPRPVGSAHYKRVESSLSNPLANVIKFHDCYHNASMTNLRDLKDPVSYCYEQQMYYRKVFNRRRVSIQDFLKFMYNIP